MQLREKNPVITNEKESMTNLQIVKCYWNYKPFKHPQSVCENFKDAKFSQWAMSHKVIYQFQVISNNRKTFTFECPHYFLVNRKTLFDKLLVCCSMHCSWLPPCCLQKMPRVWQGPNRSPRQIDKELRNNMMQARSVHMGARGHLGLGREICSKKQVLLCLPVSKSS